VSNSGIVVDCLADPQTWKMPPEEFEARVVEPMIARLRKLAKEWDGTFVQVHLRVTAMPVSQSMWDTLYTGDSE
jgi:hypothetical protein